MKHAFGIEWELAFESGVNRQQLRSALDAAGCQCVKIVSDVSIPTRYPLHTSQGHSTWELVFPPMADCATTWSIYSKVEEICEQFGAYDPNHKDHDPRRSAGMHVHISKYALNDDVHPEQFTQASMLQMTRSRSYLSGSDWFGEEMTAFAVKDIILRYYDNQKTINSMLPRSRRNAFYCENITETRANRVRRADNTIEAVRNAIGQNKYHVINLHSWNSNTIEFRQGQCTSSMKKTREWVRLLLALVYSTRTTRVNEGRAETRNTPRTGNELFRRGTRIAIQYDLMRTPRGATTREIIERMGGTEGDVRRRVSELRDRLDDAAIVTHTQQANGGSYGDGTDLTRYQIRETYTVGAECAMVPENRRGPSTVFATLSDDQFEYWQNRIELLSRPQRAG